MKFKVVRVNNKDPKIVSLLTYLQKKCLPADDICSLDSGYWWIVYGDNNIPVGFAGMVRSHSWSDCGYLCRAGILETYRGNGLQKKLINARIAQAKKLGWNWVITDTTNNPASANSLIKRGFKLYEPTKPWAFDHSLYWRKKITKDAIQRPGSTKKKAR
jgi:GNAT superfamily N-acetyltransferase